MTEPRKILLTLGSTTDAMWCGDCPAQNRRGQCEAFAHSAKKQGFLNGGAGKRVRLPECIAAEASASRMVEVALDVLAFLRTCVECRDTTGDAEEGAQWRAAIGWICDVEDAAKTNGGE